MSLVRAIYLLFISLMQTVNGAQYCFFISIIRATAVPVFSTVIVPLTSYYASL